MRKKLNRGFTLVELVVVTMLMGIITTAIVMILRPSQQHYRNITNKAYEELACINATDVINGDLRYATNLRIIYADKDDKVGGVKADTLIDKNEYPNYIKLANTEREMIGSFRARGYAEKGLTSNMKSTSGVLNKALFSDYDYQFKIEGYSTTAGNQSLTVGITATPMKQSDDRSSMVLDTDRAYEFSETFKFLNFINKGMVGDKVGGMIVDSSELPEEGSIFIFYAIPANVKSNGSVQVIDLTGNDLPDNLIDNNGHSAYDMFVPELEIKTEADFDYIEVAFDWPSMGVSDCTYRIVTEGTGVKYEHIEMPANTVTTSNAQNFYKGTSDVVRLYFEDGATGCFKIYADNGVKCDENGSGNYQSKSVQCAEIHPGDVTNSKMYIYCVKTNFGYNSWNDGTFPSNNLFLHDSPFDPNNLPPPAPGLNASITTIHYVSMVGDTKQGFAVKNASGSEAEYIVTEGKNSPATFNCYETKNYTLKLYSSDSIDTQALIYGEPNLYSTTTPFTVTKDGPSDLWIFNGTVTDDESMIPAMPEPVVIHYIWDSGDVENGFKADSTHENQVSIGSVTLTPMVLSEFVADEISFDVTANFAPGGVLNLYTVSTNTFFGSISSDHEQNEYWVYHNQLLPSAPDVQPYSVKKYIHYVQSSGNAGLAFADCDDRSSTALVDGEFLTERHTLNANANDVSLVKRPKSNFEVEIEFKKPTGRVRVFIADEWNVREFLIDITPDTVDHIYIYADQAINEEYYNDILNQIAAAKDGFGSYGTGAPVADPSCFTMAIDVPADQMNTRLFVQNSTGEQIEVYEATTKTLLGTIDKYGQQAFDISQFNGTNARFIVRTSANSGSITAKVSDNEWGNGAAFQFSFSPGGRGTAGVNAGTN